MKERQILLSLLAFRLFNGLVLRTAFNPDEHWQSSEVAHHLVFGYGFLTWEWERCIALRSVIHPGLFAIAFSFQKAFKLDSPLVVAVTPRLIQSIVAGFTDYGTYQLAKAWYNPVGSTSPSSSFTTAAKRLQSVWIHLANPQISTCSLLCSVFSWFNFFCLPRTYSNCLEAALNVWALVFFARATPFNETERQGVASASLVQSRPGGTPAWVRSAGSLVKEDEAAMPRKRKASKNKEEAGRSVLDTKEQRRSKSYVVALSFAACSVVVRPTAAGFWSVFCLLKLLQLAFAKPVSDCARAAETQKKRKSANQAAQFVRACVVVGIVATSVTVSCDSLYYGSFTFPPWNFVKFNLLSDPGRFYGAKPWHYFLLEGPGVVLLSFYPLFLLGVRVWFRAASVLPSVRQTSQKESGEDRKHTRASSFPIHAVLRDDGAALLATLFSFILLSFATHKEFRFMLAYLPQLLIVTAIGLTHLLTQDPSCLECQLLGTQHMGKNGEKRCPSREFPSSGILSLACQKGILTVVFVAQLITGVFFGFFHQVASDQVSSFLRTIPDESSVFFLTSCHEMAYYSHVHRRIPMGFLDCSPQIDSKKLPVNWQQRFWSETRENRMNFLDKLFPAEYARSPGWTVGRSQPYSDVRTVSSSSINSWFGDAKAYQFGQPGASDWKDPAECLRYRFEVPLAGRSPTHFIVPSVLMESLSEWFTKRGYVEKEAPLFDAVFKETPEGDAMWQYVHILESR